MTAVAALHFARAVGPRKREGAVGREEEMGVSGGRVSACVVPSMRMAQGRAHRKDMTVRTPGGGGEGLGGGGAGGAGGALAHHRRRSGSEPECS